MKIHKEGKKVLLKEFVIIVLLTIGLIYTPYTTFFYIILLFSIFIFTLTLYFFRVPNRKLELKDGVIYAPCDGKIVVIEETIEKEFFKDNRIQISIFMSPLNVHNQIYPICGKISYIKYHTGKYLFAWDSKASTDNESCSTVIENKKISILCKQIAGALARRIITYANINDIVNIGDELGFIKFGSRVDIFLPIGTNVKVNINDKTVSGKTVIGTF